MTILLTIFHILVCIFLVLIVLTQQGKGQDLASAFGGAGTQAAFGARGTATLLTKVTAGTAATFMVTSLLLGYVGSESGVDEWAGAILKFENDIVAELFTGVQLTTETTATVTLRPTKRLPRSFGLKAPSASITSCTEA